MKNSWLITSYYTQDTYYEDVAKQYIIKSCLALNLPHYVKKVPNLGDWQKNTHYKADFIYEMLTTSQKDIIFVDCDAKFLAYPAIFDVLECDLAAYIWKRSLRAQNDRLELLSGTMYFANNLEVKEFVLKWRNELSKTKNWEQKVLFEVLKKEGRSLKFVELPPQYCKIYDLHDKVPNPIVEHYQKSRIWRKTRDLSKQPIE